MQCTLQNLSEEYFHTFMTNMMGMFGISTGVLLTGVVIIPSYAFYSGKLNSFLSNVKATISQQTETHND